MFDSRVESGCGQEHGLINILTAIIRNIEIFETIINHNERVTDSSRHPTLRCHNSERNSSGVLFHVRVVIVVEVIVNIL